MAEITMECTMGASVKLCDHATSLFKELDQTFITFCWLKSTSPCIQEWYFTGWMMVLETPSTERKIGMKQ
jgi:hypothetical protein